MWNKVWNALPYIALYTLSMFVIGLMNIISVDGNYAFWQDPMWWNRTISQNIASVLTLTATIMLYLEKQREENEDYKSLRKTVDHEARNLDTGFGEWHFEKNKQLKKDAYIRHIQNKIGKQEKTARYKDLQVWFEGTDLEKKKNRYCRKRLRLEKQMTNEWLDQRIMSIKIDYDRIDRNFVETGELRTTLKQYQKLDSGTRKFIDNAPRFIFGFAAAAFFNAFIYDVNQMDATFWYRIMFALSILVWMFIQGKMYAISYMAKILMLDLNTRFNIIKEYLTYKVGKRKESQNGN